MLRQRPFVGELKTTHGFHGRGRAFHLRAPATAVADAVDEETWSWDDDFIGARQCW